MRRLSITAVSALIGLSLVGCGSSNTATTAGSTAGSAAGSTAAPVTGTTSGSPAAPTAATTTAHGAPSVAAWCRAYTADPGLDQNGTAAEAADKMQQALDRLEALGLPANMPQAAKAALEAQRPLAESFIKGLRTFGSETIKKLRTDPAKRSRWSALAASAAKALQTPPAVQKYVDSHC